MDYVLPRMKEVRSLWEHLGSTNKPIFLYGMGDGAEKILHVLANYDVRISGVFASDGFVRGHSFAGFRVMSYSEVRERHGSEFIALLAFSVNYEPMLSTLRRIGTECEFYAPDVPVVRTDERVFDFDYIRENREKIEQVYSLLADELSRRVFLATLNFKVSGKISYLDGITTEKAEAWQTLLCPSALESYVDLGAYTGDTIEELLHYSGGACQKITAVEPDQKNFSKLCRRLERLDVNARCLNLGAWSHTDSLLLQSGRGGRNSRLSGNGQRLVAVDSVDHILSGEECTLLKLDVEGAEAQALKGAADTISLHRPRMILSAYHRNEDLFDLPLQVLSMNPSYRFYLRHHPCIPAWETNYYFV